MEKFSWWLVVITNSTLIILKIATARTCLHHHCKTICDTLKQAPAHILALNATNDTKAKGNILTTRETDQLFNFYEGIYILTCMLSIHHSDYLQALREKVL